MQSSERSTNRMRTSSSWMRGRWFGWLVPGIGIKRWLVMILGGITLLGLGLSILLLDMYRTDTRNSFVLTLLTYASLRFLPRLLRVVVFGGVGAGLVIYGIWGLNRTLL